MIDLEFWSFALPLASLLPLAAGAKSLAKLAPPSRGGRPGASLPASLPARLDWARRDEDDLKLVFLEIGQGLMPRPIRDEPAYQEAVAVLDRLFNLDRAQTPAEERYFRGLAEMVCEYERTNCVAEREPSAAVDA